MARPIKNNADYFPHDADMRNDPRVKAVRRKFGIEGYGIYCMILEFLADAEFFEIKNNSLSMELIAGDFDTTPEKLIEVLQYCFQLNLFQLNEVTNVIDCKSLDNRLEPLLSKRKRDRGELSLSETPQNGVIASESTQSKVKESKGKKEVNISLRAKAAKALNLKYKEATDRGMENEGAAVDSIFSQFPSETETFTQIIAMIEYKRRCGTNQPTNPVTIITNLQASDWVAQLKSLDEDQNDLERIKNKPTEIYGVGTATSPAGSLE